MTLPRMSSLAVAWALWVGCSVTNPVPDGGGVLPDGGGVLPDGGGNPSIARLWLSTSGNHIKTADGNNWHGRGANLADTRSCNACTSDPANPAEVMRRMDELVDVWKANFI